MAELVKPCILVLGGSAKSREHWSGFQQVCELHEINYDNFALGDDLPVKPDLIICEMPPSAISPVELAQSFRMNYPDVSIYLLVFEKEKYLRKSFLKNGFSEVFFLPTDSKIFAVQVRREIAVLSKGSLKVFRTVPLVDLEPGLRLGFDLFIYLPNNEKYVKYVSAEDSLSKEKAEKLKKYKFQCAAVGEHQMSGFYKYSAERLRAIGDKSGISAAEKKEKQQKAIRTILTGFFATSETSDTMESGRGFLNDCGEIVKEYVMAENSQSWYNRFLKISSENGDSYNHAGSVSSLACLIAMGLGITEIEEIGLAALMHDIGIADLPPEICEKPAHLRSAEEAKIYQNHPRIAVDMIRNKKMVVSEKVMKIILQHHERFDGKGYPSGIPGEKICIEAQILAVADEIEKQLRFDAKKTPQEAAKVVLSELPGGPLAGAADPALLARLREILIPKEEDSIGRDQAA